MYVQSSGPSVERSGPGYTVAKGLAGLRGTTGVRWLMFSGSAGPGTHRLTWGQPYEDGSFQAEQLSNLHAIASSLEECCCAQHEANKGFGGGS